MSGVRLCVPVTDCYAGARHDIDPYLGGVEFKSDTPPCPVPDGVDVLMESSHGIISDDLWVWLERQRVFDFMAARGIRSFACDLGPACRRYENRPTAGRFVRSYPASEVLGQDALIEVAQEGVARIRKHFGGTLKFEILNYYPTGVYDHVCDPAFIHRFLDALDAQLLLDIGHARISAAHLGYDFAAYLDALPLHRVTEVHYSRPGLELGVWEDTHERPGPDEALALWHILARAPVRHVVIEYYASPADLLSTVRDLHTLLAEVDT